MEHQDQSIHQALDTLGEAFNEFKHTNDERLQQFQNRVNKVEVVLRRPSLETKSDEHHDTIPFMDYVRKGQDESNLQVKSLTSAQDGSGGFLIPKPVIDKIHSTLQSYSSLRNIARVTEVSTDALELLLDKGNADVGWVAETDDRPETNTPEFAKLRIPVHQVYAKPRASQKLLDDACIDLESWLISKIADRMAEAENQSFIKGDGNNKPKGFLTYPTVPLGQARWGSFEEVRSGKNGIIDDPDVLLTLFHALKPQYLKGAAWLMSRSTCAAVRQLKDANKQYLWQPGLLAGAPSSLLGHPVIISDDMPALTRDEASKAIAFGNWYEGYQIVDRAGVSLLRDPYSAKPYVEFYATKRVGGDVINFDAIKIINCAEAD
ncbi:MAG: phage major capsid protein [Alphaproteobacteria bacterium]